MSYRNMNRVVKFKKKKKQILKKGKPLKSQRWKRSKGNRGVVQQLEEPHSCPAFTQRYESMAQCQLSAFVNPKMPHKTG